MLAWSYTRSFTLSLLLLFVSWLSFCSLSLSGFGFFPQVDSLYDVYRSHSTSVYRHHGDLFRVYDVYVTFYSVINHHNDEIWDGNSNLSLFMTIFVVILSKIYVSVTRLAAAARNGNTSALPHSKCLLSRSLSMQLPGPQLRAATKPPMLNRRAFGSLSRPQANCGQQRSAKAHCVYVHPRRWV